MDVRVFSKEEISGALTMTRAIQLMRGAFADLSAGKIDSPVRTVLTNDAGTVLYKPAYSMASNIFCAKVVSVFAGNVDRGLPVTPGIIVVNDGETGMPIALMEAGFDAVIERVISPAWTTDWITPEGREKLRAYGIAPPAEGYSSKMALFGVESVACPQCGSDATERVSEFGSTACKALYRCKTCSEPFDYFKCI